jgi:hypothetical protein
MITNRSWVLSFSMIVHTSREDLVAKMLASTEHHSETTKPFTHVYDAKLAV